MATSLEHVTSATAGTAVISTTATNANVPAHGRFYYGEFLTV